MTKADLDELRRRATTLRLYGLLTAWEQVAREPWVLQLVELEEQERTRRSKEYRIRNAKIGTFKSMADFDWKQPSKIDRAQVEELFGLGFLDEPANVVLLGPNGVGKTMIAQNLAYESVVRGYATRFCVAADLLNDLSGLDGSLLRARVKKYVSPKLLVIDEVGYLRYDNRHADLLYEVVGRRYDKGGSIVVTTNKAFSEWNQVFESAACLVTLIDRLCHRAEIVEIRGESYRVKESKARSKQRRERRRG